MKAQDIRIREDATSHFLEGADKVRVKGEFDAHASYDVVRGDLTKYAYNRLGNNWMDAEDAVQTAYVNTLRTAKVNPLYNFGGLYKIWLDRAISAIRAGDSGRDKMFVDAIIIDNGEVTDLIEEAPGTEPDGELLLETQDKVNTLMNCTNTLPTKGKRIIRLSVLFGYTHKEISEMLDVTPSRIRNTLHYFKKTYAEKYFQTI